MIYTTPDQAPSATDELSSVIREMFSATFTWGLGSPMIDTWIGKLTLVHRNLTALPAAAVPASPQGDPYRDRDAIMREVTRIRAAGMATDDQATLQENAGYLYTVIENLLAAAALPDTPKEEPDVFAWLVKRGIWFTDPYGPIDEEKYDALRSAWRATLVPPSSPAQKEHP